MRKRCIIVDSTSKAVAPPVEPDPLVSWEALGALSDHAPYLKLWSLLHLVYASVLAAMGLVVFLNESRWHPGMLLLFALGSLPIIATGAQAFLELSAASAVATPRADVLDDAPVAHDIALGLQRLARLWRYYLAMVVFSIISGITTLIMAGS